MWISTVFTVDLAFLLLTEDYETFAYDKVIKPYLPLA